MWRATRTRRTLTVGWAGHRGELNRNILMKTERAAAGAEQTSPSEAVACTRSCHQQHGAACSAQESTSCRRCPKARGPVFSRPASALPCFTPCSAGGAAHPRGGGAAHLFALNDTAGLGPSAAGSGQ